MTGLEVLGGISAIIAIIDGSLKVWESARKDLKFSATFETVGSRLPILRDILQTCHEHFEPIKVSLPADAAQGLVKTVDNCKSKAERLDTIFRETIPGEDDRWYERYRMVARRLGKGGKVEELMRAMAEDAQNLVNYNGVKSASPALHTKLTEIAEEMESIAPSLSYGGTQNVSTGSSTQHNNINQGNGTMNNFASITGNPTFYLVSEPPEAQPSPSSTVPFRRDVDFVDRGTLHDNKTLLGHIEQRCSAAASRVALVGIGGAGKSQLSIEYCHRLRERCPKTWVFWIYASNVDRIEQGYRDIAERVKIPGREDPKENIFELVARWLQDESKGTWVLVLDNLDNDAILSIPQAAASRAQFNDRENQLRRPLSAYLPQSQNGVILITTRTRNVAMKLVEPRDVIVVDPMTDMDAITLLKKKLDVPTDNDDLRELACVLEYMPLAIVQAAAYIQQKGERYSVRKYIKAFQQNEKRKASLLNYEAGHLRRDPEAKNSIIITWQISFDDIREKWPSSADLLSLMSYFDRQGIPKEVLKVQSQEEEIRDSIRQKDDGVSEDAVRDDEKDEDEDISSDDTFTTSEDDMFEEAVDRLRSYSFVSLGKGETFEMHGLVQLAMRKWLVIYKEEEKWKARFIRNLNAVLSNGEYENWARCEMLFPHAKSAERQRPMNDRSVREWAQVLRKAAWYAWVRGDYREAERMCEKSTRALEKVLGRDDVETSYSLGMLASTYWSQGRWKEAEELELQVMETRKRVLGQEHRDTLISMSNLASTYRNQGRWKEAEELGLQVMETRKRVLGQEHPDTLINVDNLAMTYSDQGRWKEAEELMMQVMETRNRVLGQEHPDTLMSISNLAWTYWEQERWKEAEELGVQVTEARKKVLGQEHPDTLTSMHNLAFTMEAQGRKGEAIELMAECVQLRNRVLPAEHPHALLSASWLAKWQSSE